MKPNEGTLGIITELDVEAPMRDGVILRAHIFRPDHPGQYPALLHRTPYGKHTSGYDRYVRAGYVVVSQDARGRYSSDGDYIPFTEPHTGDGEDGYDSVEWLANQPYCNGKIGTIGASYDAWMQWMLARLRPPHLVAMCARSIPTELTEVDWWGAFRPARRVRWWLTTIAPDLRRRHGLSPPHSKEEANRIWTEVEQGRWLDLQPWMDIIKYLPPGLAEYAESWLREPHRTPWRFKDYYADITIPNLDVSGWYDHCNATIKHLSGMQQQGGSESARIQTKLIIGPWSHINAGRRTNGTIDFGPQAEVDLTDIYIRWFDYWLKGLDNQVDLDPTVQYFVMGMNQWRSTDTWPPTGTKARPFFLSHSGDVRNLDERHLCSDPNPEEAEDLYEYDPKNPVSTLWTSDLFTTVSDRRQLEHREDILTYRTPPLEEDLEIAGFPQMILYAASSAPDTDFFARLIDEYPDGAAMDICYGMVRARHRDRLDKEDFLIPGEITTFHITLGATACRFLKGHRIRLEITSSDFPNHDRNHNTGKNDLVDSEMVVAHQRVCHGGPHASRLILPVSNEAIMRGVHA